MSTITTRSGKGSPLTNTEVDNNFTNLNTDKMEKSSNLSDLASASTARTSLGLGTSATLDTGISNTNVAKFTTGVADDDFLRVNGTSIEGRSASEVVTDIGASAALRPNVLPLLYNADFDVYQRSASTTGVATLSYHAPDRWRGGTDDGNDAGRLTIARDTDVPAGEGVEYSLKYSCTTTGTMTTDGWTELTQILEGNDLQAIRKGTSNAKPLTLSVFVKSNLSGASNLITAILYDNENARHVSKTAEISSGGTWQQLIFNFPADTTGDFDMINTASLYVQFILGAGTNYTSGTLGTTWQANDATDYVSPNNMNLLSSTSNYINFAKAQLEIGEFTSATLPPFQTESHHENLRRCRRYCFVSERFGTTSSWSNSDVTSWHTYLSAANAADIASFELPVTMRAEPTVTITSTAGTSGKVTEIQDQGGATLSDQSAHAIVGTIQFIRIMEYARQSYGIIANVKADAEL